MRRKVNQIGPSTLMVSLPSKWVKKNGVKKGDELEIVDSGKDLLISQSINSKKEPIKEVLINISSNEETYIRNLLNNAYREGATKLIIKFKTEEQFKLILEIVQNSILGFEITRKDKNKCMVENVTEPSEGKFETLLKRYFYMVKESLNLLKEDLVSGQIINIEYVLRLVDKQSQYNSFLKRNIVLKKYETEHSYQYWSVLTYLALTHHCVKHIYYFLQKKNIRNVSKDTISYLEKLQRVFQKISISFFSNDFKGLEEINKEFNKILYIEGYDLFLSKEHDDQVIIYHISEMLRYTYLMTGPALGIIVG